MSDRERLSAKDYQAAIGIQDACNLSGVVHSFSKVISKVWAEARATENESTDWVNSHPICIVYANKISSLVGDLYNNNNFANAYRICMDKAAQCD